MELAEAILRNDAKKQASRRAKTRKQESTESQRSKGSNDSSSSRQQQTRSDTSSFECVTKTLDCKHVLRVQEIWEEAKQKEGNTTLATLLMFRAQTHTQRRRESISFSSNFNHQCKVLIESLDSIIHQLGPDMDEDGTGYHTWRLTFKDISVEDIANVFPDCMNAVLEGNLTESDMTVLKDTVCRLMMDVVEEDKKRQEDDESLGLYPTMTKCSLLHTCM